MVGIDVPHAASLALGFSVQLPSGWALVEEDATHVDAAARVRDELPWWQGQWFASLDADDRALARWAQREGRRALQARLGDASERARVTRALHLLRELAVLEHDVERAADLGTLLGYARFETSTPLDGSLEVTRYRMARPMSALEFYKAAKPSAKSHWRGTRVCRMYALDGLPAVRLYVDFGALGDRSRESAKYVHHYVTDEHDGWVIEAGCDRDAFDAWRDALLDVSRSFRRV